MFGRRTCQNPQKKLTFWSVYVFSLIILGGDLGIVDTWHVTTNLKIMEHAYKKVLQFLTCSKTMLTWVSAWFIENIEYEN